ncbi:MAG: hypothetical protein A2Z42_04090 [Candidatus Woykebacteria bacterium RBG_19FT_COMBO_43_10]|uniref:LTD domain-containing protein n=1 Tax=Candidatus Woykebacteria bacterium RBG_19FT_COMBO_43_10 TaxID=1802598 RepID=A0A1G1WHD8_9BACT|nr:MAG: hypothetical protein A2Z42_04090 [Candidatus Woykebacteria bacterium RBG_19FT_COMBO_43_10]
MVKRFGFVLVLVIGSFFYLPAQIATAQAGPIKINEFAAITAGTKADPDWVEIYNSSSEVVPLENWSLKDSTETNKLNLTGCISPKGFRKFDFLENLPNRLNNSGDEIRLFDKNTNLVEEISYFSNEIPSHQKGESTGRNPDRGDDWEVLTNPTPTNSACTNTTDETTNLSLKVSLSEIYPNPEKGGDEWVEIYNPNSSSVNLAGWLFSDSANHKKSLSGPVSPKSYKFFTFSSGWLNNSGDTLNLTNSAGKLVEKYSFGSIDKGLSLAKDAGNKWRATTSPTPGKPNTITGPISNAMQENSIPTQTDEDTLTSTGLNPAFDYLGETFTLSGPNDQSIQTSKEKVAGVSEQKDTKDSLTTLLIAAGFAFLGTAVVWPFLEKKKRL